MEGAARFLGSGRRQLQRRLEAQGLTYRSLVTEIRMQRAKSLIEGTEAPIKRIGLELGYADPAHFTRAFGKYYGFAPSHLRLGRKEA
jgi:AraC-like DNA-binding protein